MEPRYLLDTNICIYIRQKKPDEVLRRFRKLRPGEAALSVITYGELLYGAAKSKQREAALERLRELVHLLPALSLPESAAEAYRSIRAGLEARGEMIEEVTQSQNLRSFGRWISKDTPSSEAVSHLKQISHPLVMRGVPVLVANYETAKLAREANFTIMTMCRG
jgi:tRNA(fMet)-specific endonuclease VapC